jgi:tetratricopeptide (TPR) repeat protein/predicted Ser/Thr protein kinase
MNPDRWARANDVFHRALELEGDARTKYLEQTCGSDAAMLNEVRSLLAADAQASGAFLETPAGTQRDTAPSQVGPWRLERELGRGGMGTVFLAERSDGAFTMRAALKVLRRGLDTDDLLARFRDERQILASLEHPSIARLLDGGALPDGRPWLAMEYVEGETLLDACARLTRDERLALFRKLLDAVQYAHRNLVVHRDLKPGNVLVTKGGTPKLLDFGIAKVLDPRGIERTKTGEFLLTPAYASPEQVRAERVTTASDVWALGVMLYELLVGRRPFEGEGQALAQKILHDEPTPPGLGADLDGILFTALRKEPALRYPSVEALGEDLERLVSGLPVRARPATWGYRVGKFISRHRLAVGGVTVGAVLLAGGVVSTLHQAEEARQARARAEASRARAEELVDFMLGDLRRKLEPSSRLDVLEDVSKAVQTYFDTVPAAEQSPVRRARTLQQLATVKLAQGKGDDAAQLIVASRTALEGAGSTPEVGLLRAAAANLQGQLHESRGELDGALTEFAETKRALGEVLRARPNDAHVLALAGDAYNDCGRLLFSLGKLDEALAAHLEARAVLDAHSTVTGRDVTFARGKTLMYLGRAQEAQGKLEEAQRSFRGNLAIARQLHADLPQDIELEDNLAVVLNDLGRALRTAGNAAEAEPLAEEALGFSKAALARDPDNALRIDTLSATHSFLGRAREELGKFDGALSEFEADVQLSERLLAKEPESAFVQAALADGLTNIGRVQRKRGELALAKTAHLRALALREGLAQKDESFRYDVAVSKLELGRVLRLAKENATPSFEAALAILKVVAAGDDAPAKQRGKLAQVLIELGRRDEAAPLVKQLMDAGAADAELRALWR